MGLLSSFMGKKGDDPKKLAAKGLKELPGMERDQLNQALLMQKLLQTQMGEANLWERVALAELMDSERAASESVDASSKKEAAAAEQSAANAGLSNVTSSINRRKAAAGRGAKEKRQLSAQRVGKQAGVRQAATNMRGQVRQGLLGVQENIQRVKADSDLKRLHLLTKNSLPGVSPMLKAPTKGLLGTAMGLAGYAMGGPTGGMIGQSVGDSIGSTFAQD